MSILDLFRRGRKEESTSIPNVTGSYSSPLAWGRPEAMSNSAFWACITMLAAQYATLPFVPYRQGSRQTLERNRLLYQLIERPNPYMDHYQWFYIMGFNFEMHGVAVAIIERNRNGLPQNLYPVSPGTMIAHWVNGELWYKCSSNGIDYPRKDVLVITNTPVGYDAVLSPIQYAQDDLDLVNRCKQLQSEYYNGGSIVGNYIKVPDKAYETTKANIKAVFDAASGFRNMVLPESVSVEPIKVGGEDVSKLVSAQDWDIKEVARRFHVPPFLIGDIAGASVNAETQAMQFATYCLQPRCKAWEIAWNNTICSDDSYVKFELKGLMRGDHATRANWYKQMWDIGVFSINEIRGFEDMEPLPGDGGNAHLILTNYGTVDDVVAGKYSMSSPSPWDIEIPEKKEQKPMEEKRKRLDEKTYIAEAEKPAKTARAKIERLIRQELQQAIDRVKTEAANGTPVSELISIFNSTIEELHTVYGEQYTSIYTAVMNGMLPVVQVQSGKDQMPNEADVADFVQKYVDSLETRVKTKGATNVSAALEDPNGNIDGVARDLAREESETEVNRSSNAFSVFLMGQLGVQTMRIVCNADACTFCKGLDGKVAEVNGYILKKGSSHTDSDGEVVPVNKNYRHPPFHEHCSCFVVPN